MRYKKYNLKINLFLLTEFYVCRLIEKRKKSNLPGIHCLVVSIKEDKPIINH